MKRALALLFLTGLVGPALAEPLDVRRRYEEAMVQNALRATHLVIDPHPEGKIIERIALVANDVIQPGDYGIPYRIPIVHPLLSRVTWLNHLHVRTRDHVIRRELLFHVGEKLQDDLVAESGRNLRALGPLITSATQNVPTTFILAVARIVVCQGSTPDRVIVLVVTKDNWTLRFNTDFQIDQARLDALSFSIAENNVAGLNKTISVQYALDPGRHTVGLGWADPRIAGSRHQLQLVGDVFLNRETSQAEGGFAQLIVGRPLFSLRTQWSWQLSTSFLQDLARTFQGGDIYRIKYNDELIPDIFARRQIIGDVAVTRSFGVLDKLNLSLGYHAGSGRYEIPASFPSTLSAAARAYYGTLLPRSESYAGPYLSAVAFRAAYVRLQNINTFALSEDFQVGPSFGVKVQLADPIFGFSSRFVAVTGSYAANYWGHDNLILFSLSATARLQGGIVANQSWVNQIYDGTVHEVTPRFGPFRLHIAGSFDLRRNDLTQTRDTLGSDTGLRGFEPRYFIGNNFYVVNVELRSIALNLWTVHIGGVAFYDGGDAPSTLYTASWHQDAGVGLRVLFPQFDRDVLRFDLAFPFERLTGGAWSPRFSVAFGQAF